MLREALADRKLPNPMAARSPPFSGTELYKDGGITTPLWPAQAPYTAWAPYMGRGSGERVQLSRPPGQGAQVTLQYGQYGISDDSKMLPRADNAPSAEAIWWVWVCPPLLENHVLLQSKEIGDALTCSVYHFICQDGNSDSTVV